MSLFGFGREEFMGRFSKFSAGSTESEMAAFAKANSYPQRKAVYEAAAKSIRASNVQRALRPAKGVHAGNAARLGRVLNPLADATQRNAAKLADANDTRSPAVKRNASRLASLIGRGNTR